MTEGAPLGLLLSFSLPLVAGNVFQQLYTFVDTMVVGQVLGVDALAALGASEWMIFLLFASVQGLVQGFSVIISQRFGGGDHAGLKAACAGAGCLTAAGAVLFTAAGQAMIVPALHLLHTPETIIGMSSLYLRILYAGVPVSMAYNLFSAVLRALGNSKTPLQAMTAASVCNIALDILFVAVFRLGIAGAAYATLIAQLLASVLCLRKLAKIELLHLTAGDFRGNRAVILEELKVGAPMGLQNMLTAGGGLVVQSVVNGFGILFIAGYTAANKLYGLLEIAASSYGYAVSAYTGQNLGAGLTQRIRYGLRAANLMGIVTALMMSLVMLLFGKPILACFIAGNAAEVSGAIRIGYRFLVILSCAFPLLYVLYIMRSCMQGMGNSILPMYSSLMQLFMRCGCALVLTRYIGETGIFAGEVCAWLAADCMLILSYFYCIKRVERK